MDNSEEHKELPLSENKSYIPDRFGGKNRRYHPNLQKINSHEEYT
ncbi:MAG: hypothetical protein QUS12_08190 [Methanosarcina sp.]|nr:hypothetical protein [Methanosarcina sp.]